MIVDIRLSEEAVKDNATEEEPSKKLGGTLKLNTPIKEAMEEEVYYGTEGNVIDPVQVCLMVPSIDEPSVIKPSMVRTSPIGMVPMP